MKTLQNNLILPIPGTTGYFASEDGNIYSTNYGDKSLKQMRVRANNCGYLQVSLSNNGGPFANKLCSVHRLIATTFIPNTESKAVVNHIDGIKSNNSVNNLEWATHSENTAHAFANGLITVAKGGDHHASKLTTDQAINLINDLLAGKSNSALAKKYKLHSRYISLIRHKKRWSHLWDSHFKDKSADTSFTDPKEDTLDRDLVIKELLTTSEACRAIAMRHNVDQTTLSRIRSGSRIPSIWQPYVTKYYNLAIKHAVIDYETITAELLGTTKSLAAISKEFGIGTRALQKVRAGKPPKKWKPYVEQYIKLA